MSDLSSTSYCKDNNCDSGFSPIMLIFLLLFCGGDNGLLGCGGNRSNGCGCGSGGGLGGMLPIILMLCLCGGSF